MAQSSDNRSHLNLLIMLELLKKVLKLIHNPLIIQIDGFRKMESKSLFITLKNLSAHSAWRMPKIFESKPIKE